MTLKYYLNQINKKKVRLSKSSFLFSFFILFSCSHLEESHLQGNTMGTSYNIKIHTFENRLNLSKIQTGIDSILNMIDIQMSLYNPQSEIVQFNNSVDSIKVSKEFENVLLASKHFNKITKGAFDISVGPLVKLWGFHNFSDNWMPPSDDKIAEIQKYTGNNYWNIKNSILSKSVDKLQIDVNAIAKGFGVDQISLFLLKSGFTQFLVEIGGEVYCHGLKKNNLPWKIGIELPSFENREIASMVKLKNRAMATSGNYRNYYKYNGKIFSHTINPQDGYPVFQNLVSATVVAPTSLEADALATALMVMGSEKALELINQLENVECLLIERFEDGSLNEIKSNGMSELLELIN